MNKEKNKNKINRGLIVALIGSAIFMGYKHIEARSYSRSLEGTINLISGKSDGHNPFWRSISRVDTCKSIDDLSSKSTYTDLLSSTYHCILDEKYDMAAENFSVSFIYSRFDSERTNDHSIPKVTQHLFLQLSEDIHKEKSGFELNESMNNIFKDKKLCEKIFSLETPNYIPSYILNYDNGTDTPNSIILDYDNEANWKRLIGDYPDCKQQTKP